MDPNASRPSAPPSAAAPSRIRPMSQSAIPTSADEKRALHNQMHSQLQNPHSHARHSSSGPPSRAESPAPAPIQQHVAPTSTAASSRAPSEADTNDDDDADVDGDGDGPSQWLFHEDELTDLPPSYFEATAVDQDD